MVNTKNYFPAGWASLPWYDDQTTARALDEFWNAMAWYLWGNNFDHLSSKLQRDVDLVSIWRNPQLVLGQCCGPDLFTRPGCELRVIARPKFSDLDCEPGCYYSHIVSRTDWPVSPVRMVVNSLSSRSGCMSLIEWVREKGLSVTAVLISGSHSNSLSMLDRNQADLAAIDAHSLKQCDLRLNLPVIGRSRAAFTPPFVSHCRSGIDTDLLFSALSHAVSVKGSAIGISGLTRCSRDDYKAVGMDSMPFKQAFSRSDSLIARQTTESARQMSESKDCLSFEFALN